MSRRSRCQSAVLTVLALALAAFNGVCATTNNLTVNFQNRIDPPLFKKFAVMNSGLVTLAEYQHDIKKFALLNAQSLRMDLFMGGSGLWEDGIVQGSVGDLQYTWTNLDWLSGSVNSNAIWPYWSLSYCPSPEQTPPAGGTWWTPPASLADWQSIAQNYAQHYLQSGIRIGYFEIWNEPDGGNFLDQGGTMAQQLSDYLNIYNYAAAGLRAGNPDAVIGGPSLAGNYNTSWPSSFVADVYNQNLALDFYSAHAVAVTSGSPRTYGQSQISAARAALGNYGATFATTEIHLNEYHPYLWVNGTPNYPNGQAGLGVDLFEEFNYWLAVTDLTLLHYAQLEADTIGLIDSSGTLQQGFFSFSFYGDMPVERCAVAGSTTVGCFASANAAASAVVVWNTNSTSQNVQLSLSGIAFTQAQVSVYAVNAGSMPTVNVFSTPPGIVPTETFTTNLAGAMTWSFVLPSQGFYYLKVQPATATAAPAPIGNLIRLRHYYQNRAVAASNYAEFDWRTWSAHLGMGSQAAAVSQVGVMLTNVAPLFMVRFQIDGNPPTNSQSVLGFRVDYHAGGSYAKSVFVHGGLAGGIAGVSAAWGTRRTPDEIMAVNSLSQLLFDAAAHAPANWDGRADVSFIMANTGAGTRARVYLDANIIQPQLGLAPGVNGLALNWPGWAPDFTLWSASNLVPPVAWSPVAAAIVQTNGQCQVSNPGYGAGNLWFRLQSK